MPACGPSRGAEGRGAAVWGLAGVVLFSLGETWRLGEGLGQRRGMACQVPRAWAPCHGQMGWHRPGGTDSAPGPWSLPRRAGQVPVPLGLLSCGQASSLHLEPLTPRPCRLGPPVEGVGEWPPGWRAGRAGTAAFLGIVWGKCIVRAAQSRPLAPGGLLLPPPKCCLRGRELGLGQGCGLCWGLSRDTAPAGGSAPSADWRTETRREGWASTPSGAWDMGLLLDPSPQSLP